MSINYTCPSCKNSFPAPFKGKCPNLSCGFNHNHLTGLKFNTREQTKSWGQHTSLVSGAPIGLYGKPINCSFDHNGIVQIDDLVRYTISYGTDANVSSLHGGKVTEVRLIYVQDVIGSGMTIYNPGNIFPCSGLCIMSVNSVNYGHIFPASDPWVQHNFGGNPGSCRECGATTSFAVPFCSACFKNHNNDWKSLL